MSKDMTWEELVNKAKDSKFLKVWSNENKYICISQRGNHFIKFYKNGDICIDCEEEEERLIAEFIRPNQMYQIMEILRWVKKSQK